MSTSHLFKMKIFIALTVLISAVSAVQGCSYAINPTEKFTLDKFMGRWYEIGSYRSGGAIMWDKDCFCSTSTATKDPLAKDEGDSLYTYTCNKESATGDLRPFQTKLMRMRRPGQWTQQVIPGIGATLSTVVVLEDSYALVYRCGGFQDSSSYTVQMLSREPTLDSEIIENMKAKVVQLGLNPEGIEYKSVPHVGCTYEGH